MRLFSSIKDNLHNAYQVISREVETGQYPIWRHPIEDFRNGSILQVAENDVALLLDNGKILEQFSGGRFTLSSSNYPFIDRLRASFSGGETSYKYTVFFISKRPMTNLMWGTPEPMEVAMQMTLPSPGAIANFVPIKLQIGANYTAAIDDPKTFLLKDMQGTTAVARTKDELNKEVVRPMIGQTVKSNIAKAIQSVDGGIWSIQTQTDEIAKKLEDVLNDRFAEYGMRLGHFYIDTLNVLDTEEWVNFKKSFNEFTIRQNEKRSEALGDAGQIEILGNNWQRVQARDIMQTMAQNPGAGGIAATGAGLGMGMAAGGVFGGMAQAMFAPMQQTAPQPQPAAPAAPSRFAPRTASTGDAGLACPSCGKPVPSGQKFCGECGTKIEAQKVFCVNCGNELAPGQKFCGACGTKMT